MIRVTAPNLGNNNVMESQAGGTASAAALAQARVQARDMARAINRAGFRFGRDAKGPVLIPAK